MPCFNIYAIFYPGKRGWNRGAQWVRCSADGSAACTYCARGGPTSPAASAPHCAGAAESALARAWCPRPGRAAAAGTPTDRPAGKETRQYKDIYVLQSIQGETTPKDPARPVSRYNVDTQLYVLWLSTKKEIGSKDQQNVLSHLIFNFSAT